MAKPRLLLLDEPSLGLSPMLIQEIVAIVRKIHSDGISVILVEQNAHIALELSDHAYVLQNGKITLSGTGRELLDHPRVLEAYLGG
jgi:branched-chain amino acid transport system ATP-binding protein